LLQEAEALYHVDRPIAALAKLEELDARLASDLASADARVRAAAAAVQAEMVEGGGEGDAGTARWVALVRRRGRECRALVEESHTVGA
jgi:hypothetical protein